MVSELTEGMAGAGAQTVPLRERGLIGRLLSSVRDGAGFDVVLAMAGLLFLLAFAGFPFAYNFVMSFQQVDVFNLATFFRPFVGFDNFIAVMSQPEFLLVVRNTVIFVVGSIAGQFVIGLGLALFFHQSFPGAQVIRGLFLVSWVMPGLAVGAIWGWILAGDFGVLNFILRSLGIIQQNIFWKSDPNFSIWAVTIANIWLGIGFNTLLLSVGLAGIPRDLYEAAELDGAGPLQRLWHVTIPMMRATIGAVLALGLILTLQQFDLFPAITEGGPANSSTVAQYWAWQTSFRLYDFARGATISVMLVVLVLIASAIYVRSTRREVHD